MLFDEFLIILESKSKKPGSSGIGPILSKVLKL